MNENLTDFDRDLPGDPEEEYQALVRSLTWKKGFGLIFIRSSPAEGERLIKKVRQDIPKKNIEVLRLEQPIDNLYEIVDGLPDKDQINILFITGIEKSFVEYIKPGYGGQGDYYKLDSVPRVLGHLNLQRERFRDNFNICFVFILPLFGLKYFIRRAPDFFDWRSGVFEFPTDWEIVESESRRIIDEGGYQKCLSLTLQERNQKIVEIEHFLEEDNQTPSDRADLLLQLGNLLFAAKEYEAAIASYDQALKIKPDSYYAWKNRGNALFNLGRYEAAITSYDQALKFKPDYDYCWKNRGNALFNLGRYKAAITSYDQALKIKANDEYAWKNRGNALRNVGRYEEAITSYDQALKFKPDDDYAWNNRGNALLNLGHYEAAIASYDQALKIKAKDEYAWKFRGDALGELGRYEEAITSYDQALKIKPDDDYAWNNQGNALRNVGRYEEAIASFKQALKIKPDLDIAWYYKACCYALQADVAQSIENLQKAIALNPLWREEAKTDSDFDQIRQEEQFQLLMKES